MSTSRREVDGVAHDVQAHEAVLRDLRELHVHRDAVPSVVVHRLTCVIRKATMSATSCFAQRQRQRIRHQARFQRDARRDVLPGERVDSTVAVANGNRRAVRLEEADVRFVAARDDELRAIAESNCGVRIHDRLDETSAIELPGDIGELRPESETCCPTRWHVEQRGGEPHLSRVGVAGARSDLRNCHARRSPWAWEEPGCDRANDAVGIAEDDRPDRFSQRRGEPILCGELNEQLSAVRVPWPSPARRRCADRWARRRRARALGGAGCRRSTPASPRAHRRPIRPPDRRASRSSSGTSSTRLPVPQHPEAR